MPYNTQPHIKVKLEDVVPLPIEQRDWFTTHDAAVYIRTVYNLKVGYVSIVRWMKVGMTGKDGQQYFLKSVQRAGKRMISKADLEAFLSQE